jgi:hypothetical protein
MIKIICDSCKKSFYKPKCHVRKNNFCSTKCHGDFLGGKPFFDSTGIPSWNKGTKGVMHSWNKGKTGIYSKQTIARMRQAGLKRPPEKHPRWKGGVRYHRGYRFIFSPEHPNKTANNCVAEQRLVVEKHLGRFLNRKEIVHHINHIKSDNRLENLILFSDNHCHMLFHSKCGDIKGRPIKLRKPAVCA